MTKMNRRNAIGLMTAASATALCSGAYAQQRPKIAFLMNENADIGWYFEHTRGAEQVKAAYGDRAQIDTFYNVKEWGKGDADKMRELAQDGYGLIFACSFGYMKSTVQVAFEAPNTKFEHCGGYIRAANLSTYSARWYEGRVLEGFVAGAMTKKNRIGYLASFPIPQVLRGINAAYLAAKSVNPEVEFDVVWLNSWYSPEKEEEASRMLIGRGADVLLAHTNTTKPTEVAEELGAYVFGKASDMSKFGPNATLSATINNWGPYYVRRVGEFLDNKWTTTETWGGLSDEMIAIAKLSDIIPNRVHLQATDIVERIRASKLSPFEGPIRKQDGKGWLAPGETASDYDLLTMNFFVEGINSVIPSKN